jgi:hypothetical protein
MFNPWPSYVVKFILSKDYCYIKNFNTQDLSGKILEVTTNGIAIEIMISSSCLERKPSQRFV